MIDVVWLIPALPLFGFVVLVVFGRRLGEPLAGWFATVMSTGAFAVTVGVFFDLLSHDSHDRRFEKVLYEWLPVGSLHVDVGFLVDPLSITMALFITGVSALIHLYSIGYMHGDPKFSKFFIYLNLFVFSMLMLVLGNNLLVTFVGWEGVGTCSYLLISFWFTRSRAATAGKKAFVTNRIGDWGFMLAMFLAFQYLGGEGLNYLVLNEAGRELGSVTITAICLLLFVGAIGKSAQLPLYLWLPDAMEGPTPVSALIHAATMVTGGVFLMTRISPLLGESQTALNVIAIVGVATAFFAATIAVAQNDIKRVLAYSTISQLGYMFLAIGVGAYVPAIFHMVTHAFFKALLFLGAGSVIHGMHDEQDMRYMGALRKVMPVTTVTFIIGWLAICGVPPFSGFFSKDEILLYAFDRHIALWIIGLVTALLTAYYMTRQVIMVFFGEARWDEARPAPDTADDDEHAAADAHGEHHGVQPHESNWLILTPLVILAGLALVGGILNLPFGRDLHYLTHWLEPVVEGSERVLAETTEDLEYTLLAVSAVVAFSGIGLAWLVYSRRKVKAIEPAVLAHAWYVDEAVSSFVGGPGEEGFAGVAAFDAVVIDGAVNGTGGVLRQSGSQLRRLQTGLVRNYALGVGVGAVALLAWFVGRGL